MSDKKSRIKVFFIAGFTFLFTLLCLNTNIKADNLTGITDGYTETNLSGAPVEVFLDGYTLSDGERLYALTWSEENGQDDLVGYEMSDAGDGRFIADIVVNRHKSYGKYFTHFYANRNGNMQFLSGIDYVINESQNSKISVDIESGESGAYGINIAGVSGKLDVKEVKAAVWSNDNQSDLIWYTAKESDDGSYYAEAKMSDYGYKNGTFNVHVYKWDSYGNATFLGANLIEYKKEVNSININYADGQYTITLSASGISNARCAIWSEENGQDDLSWNKMNYDSQTGAYTLSFSQNILKNTGKAFAHVYTDIGSTAEFVSGLEFNTEQIKEKLYAETDTTTGSFKLVVNGSAVSSDAESVVIPVWSKSDQSDIVWYEAKKDANGNYTVEANISNHGGTLADYYAHAYGCMTDGSKSFIDGKILSFKTADTSIECTKQNNKQYLLSIHNPYVAGGIKKLEAAVWSDNNGQDDLIWTEASKVSNTEYQLTINTGDHPDNGHYSVHVYADDNNGNMVFVGAYSDLYVYSNVSGDISFNNVDNKNGTFEVSIKLSNATEQLKELMVASWTAGDQSDIKWYTAEKVSDDTYKVTVDVKNHKNNYGTYHIHVYAKFDDDELDFVTGSDKYFGVNAEITVSEPDGSYSRRLSYPASGLSSVRFGVWSNENGQDDFRWYDGTKNGNEFYVDVPLSNHAHSGTFTVHLYTGNTFVSATQFSMINYVEWAINTANDDSVGYSQENRNLNPDVDCSSFVYYSLYNNGFKNNLSSVAFYTGTEVYYLQRCGFQMIQYSGVDSLKPGDILWYRRNGAGHTEIYIGNNKLVGARDSVVNGVDYPQGGDQTGKEVAVGDFFDPGWMFVLRYYE